MAINFPTALDSFALNTDGVDDVLASDVNDLQDAIAALEVKVGVNSSAVATSVDYLLKNAASINPGHHHTDASIDALAYTKLTYSGLTAGHAMIASAADAASFRAIQESDIADGGLLARLAASEVVVGQYNFVSGLKLQSKNGTGWALLRGELSTAATVTYYMPCTDGTAGEALVTDGSGHLSWAASASAGGTDTQVQFNDAGVLGGDSALTWDKATNALTLGGTAQIGRLGLGVAADAESQLYAYGTQAESIAIVHRLQAAPTAPLMYLIDESGNNAQPVLEIESAAASAVLLDCQIADLSIFKVRDTGVVVNSGYIGTVDFTVHGQTVPNLFEVDVSAAVATLKGEYRIDIGNGSYWSLLPKTTTLTTDSGASKSVAAFLPAKAACKLLLRITTTITGPTSISIGTAGDPDAFGTLTTLTAGETTSMGNWTILVSGYPTGGSDEALVVTANGGDFTAGAIRFALIAEQFIAPTS